MFKVFFPFLIFCFLAGGAFAYNPKEGSGLPVPRFASMKSDNAFVRTGPSMDYPIKYVMKREGLPVQIIQEFDAWRKIKDPSGDEGWVHKLLLSGKRTALTQAALTQVYHRPNLERMVAELEKGVVITAEECNGEWCKIEFFVSPADKSTKLKGWIAQKNLFGIDEGEKIN